MKTKQKTMNRVIKFRAWDGETKEMFSWEQIGKLDGCTGSWCYTSNPNWILMQFTGLTDKNGKEIYEGDILKGGHYKAWEVKWDGDELGWNIGNHVQHYYEVIGNIYENHELLNN